MMCQVLRWSVVILSALAIAGCNAEESPKASVKSTYKVGSTVADFSLKDSKGAQRSLKELAQGQKFLVLDFWSPTCPSCEDEEPRFIAVDKKWRSKGVVTFHVASNGADNTADGLKGVQESLKEHEITFPILMDPGSKIADAFGAEVTPTVFIIDAKTLAVKYSGASSDGEAEGNEAEKTLIDRALSELVDGRDPKPSSTEPNG